MSSKGVEYFLHAHGGGGVPPPPQPVLNDYSLTHLTQKLKLLPSWTHITGNKHWPPNSTKNFIYIQVLKIPKILWSFL